MKAWLGVGCIILGLVFGGQAFADGPEVVNIDQKISIHADNITLGDLFRLWDQATGMHSMVSPDLAEQRVSVRFTGLNVSDALRRISDGHQFGYILAEDQVVVTPREPIESAAAPEPQEALSPDSEASQAGNEPQFPEAERMKPEPLPPPRP